MAADDPTVREAYLVPESTSPPLVAAPSSSGLRWMIQGIRLLELPSGVVRAARQRVDEAAVVVPLPPRLGGGFLFVLGETVLRSEDWLGDTRPLFVWSRPLAEAFVGLDRVYLRTKSGAHLAIDPTTGASLDLGPWPAAPFVTSYAALDGWRAIAVTDVRGVLGTLDAGRTWTPLDVPPDAVSVGVVRRSPRTGNLVPVTPDIQADAFLARSRPRASPGREPLADCYLVSDSLVVSSLAGCKDVGVDGSEVPELAAPLPAAVAAQALRSVLRDGWPLRDGTALVVDGGALTRVRLADGAVVESVPLSMENPPGHCHAVGLSRTLVGRAFGFVCGQPGGPTELFAYDDSRGRLELIRRFATPRVVHAPGNGAWLVRGGCDDRSSGAPAPSAVCVGLFAGTPTDPRYSWFERRTVAADSGYVTVTGTGRLVEISPGTGPTEGGPHITIVSLDGTVEEHPIVLRDPTEPARRLLRRGTWLDGFEERTPGVLSGWLVAEGSVLGVELDLDGGLKTGAIRDLGSPFVSGRYGLGWITHRAWETTDGGMTWTPFDAPSPLAPSQLRACGPAGCIAEGWLRVGWATPREAHDAPVRPVTMPPIAPAFPPEVELKCEAVETTPPQPTAPPRFPDLFVNAEPPFVRGELRQLESRFSPPKLSRSDHLVSVDLAPAFAPQSGVGPLARLYAWGAASGDWSLSGRWLLRWGSPFEGHTEIRSSAATRSPFIAEDVARATLISGFGGPVTWSAIVSDDSAHILVLARRAGRDTEVVAVDEGGAPTPVHRADGDPWGGVEAALWAMGDWFIVTTNEARPNTLQIFKLGAGTPVRIAEIVRSPTAPPSVPRLARRTDGATIGLVLDGEVSHDRAAPRRWVVPIAAESGEEALPVELGATDLGDRKHVPICADADGIEWTLEAPWPTANVKLQFGESLAQANLTQVYARLRLSPERACIERLVGDMSSSEVALSSIPHVRPTGSGGRSLTAPVAVLKQGHRLGLRCTDGATK